MNRRAGALRVHKVWDGWGILASGLCVAHCVATPVVALALPAIVAVEGVTHGVLAIAVLLFGLLALVPGARVHGGHSVLVLGFTGVASIWTALLLSDELAGDTVRDALTVLGGLVMVSAHVFNAVLCRRCETCRAASSAALGGGCNGACSSP